MRTRIIFLFIFLAFPYLTWAQTNFASNNKATLITLNKTQKILNLWHHNQLIASYRVALGEKPKGPKRFKNDHRTPEGRYYIDNKNSTSAYHLSLRLSYPNKADIAYAQDHGQKPGGEIRIHGLPNDMDNFPDWVIKMSRLHYLLNWTDGCIAVTNEEIEEIWNLVPYNTPIEISP